MDLGRGERYYKGYFIPGKPGWLRTMVSKQLVDGSIEARNIRVFIDNAGHVLWHKPGLHKVQSPEDFERDLGEFKHMIEEAGLLIFLQDYSSGEEGKAP